MLKYCISICVAIGSVMFAWPLRWINNHIDDNTELLENTILLHFKVTLHLVVGTVRWEKLQDIIQCAISRTLSSVGCTVKIFKWFYVYYVSVPALSIQTTSGHSDPSHPLLPGILSYASHPASGVTSSLYVNIHNCQKKVRIAFLCWLESAGPTIHPGQWGQSLKKERK